MVLGFHYGLLSASCCPGPNSCQVPPPICDILFLQQAAGNGAFRPALTVIYQTALSLGSDLTYVAAYLACPNNKSDACISLLIQAMQQATGYMTLLNYAVNPDGWENDAFWGIDCCDQENDSAYNTCPFPRIDY